MYRNDAGERKQSMILLVILLLMLPGPISFYLPAMHENILIIKMLQVVCLASSMVAFFLYGLVMIRYAKGVRSFISCILMIIVGIVVGSFLWKYAQKVLKDFELEPQKYMLEGCTVDRDSSGRGPDHYYLEGTYKGARIRFNITGAEDVTLSEIDYNAYNVLVMAYPNTRAVTQLEVYKGLEDYANSIPLETLKGCITKPTEDEYEHSKLILLWEDKEQDIALYGVHQGIEVGCLLRVKDVVQYIDFHWYNKGRYLPNVRYKNIDNDSVNELLIESFYEIVFEVNGEEIIEKKSELYIYDILDGKRMMIDLNNDECFLKLKDRINIFYWDEGYITLELDGNEVYYEEMPIDEMESMLNDGSFYPVGGARFDLDKMTIVVKPVHVSEEKKDFREIEFRLEYKAGVINILEGVVLLNSL